MGLISSDKASDVSGRMEVPEGGREPLANLNDNEHLMAQQQNIMKTEYSRNYQDANGLNPGVSVISLNQSDILDADSERYEQLEQFLSNR